MSLIALDGLTATEKLDAAPQSAQQGLADTVLFRVFIFVLSLAILVSRRPDSVLQPQFWAEDGWLFYSQAHNAGLLHPLFWPYGGYLQFLPRLVAALAQAVPLLCAPLLFNLMALAVQALPVQFLFSSRLSGLGTLPTRGLLAMLYLSLPNSFEICGNLASVQWNLAVVAFLVMISASSQGAGAKIFDFLVISMTGLTGPFALMLSPVAFLDWRRNRNRWKLVLTVTLAACAGIQVFLIFGAGGSHRLTEPLHAGVTLLCEILADHVFLSVLIGRNAILHGHILGAVFVATVGIAFLVYGAVRGPWPLRLYIFFSGLVLTCSLASPLPVINGIPSQPPLPGWQGLELGLGQRYWYIPMLAVVATLFWLMKPATPSVLRTAAMICFFLMPFGAVRDWRHPARIDMHFNEYVEMFRRAPSGAVVEIPENPPGWSFRLVKR
jgi:hypothetical protein